MIALLICTALGGVIGYLIHGIIGSSSVFDDLADSVF